MMIFMNLGSTEAFADTAHPIALTIIYTFNHLWFCLDLSALKFDKGRREGSRL